MPLLPLVLVAGLGAAAILGVRAATTEAEAAAVEAPAPPSEREAPHSPDALYPVTVRGPTGPPTVLIGHSDGSGAEVRANCTTCHATKEPTRDNRSSLDLDDFHQGLIVDHGSLSCLTCHNPESYDRLRLADGSSLEYVDSIQLCAQCHGPQFRDWSHGSHGGMTGYWDLSRGPRTRNHCVVCHDPHAPQIGQVLPAPPPNDRFLRSSPGAHRSAEDEHHD